MPLPDRFETELINVCNTQDIQDRAAYDRLLRLMGDVWDAGVAAGKSEVPKETR